MVPPPSHHHLLAVTTPIPKSKPPQTKRCTVGPQVHLQYVPFTCCPDEVMSWPLRLLHSGFGLFRQNCAKCAKQPPRVVVNNRSLYLYRNFQTSFKWCFVYFELCKVSLLTHFKVLKNLMTNFLFNNKSFRKLWKVAEVTCPSILPLINNGSMNHSPWTPPTTMASSGLTMEGAVHSMVRVKRTLKEY